MGLADLHIHSIYSWDGLVSVPTLLDHAANETNLDVIAITDHDNITGAMQALELAPRYAIEVIAGCEITTLEGHLLALFIDRPIPSKRSLIETLLLVGEQGGICVAPHPMARGGNSLSAQSIHTALADPDAAQILVGIEAVNASLEYMNAHPNVQDLCASSGLAKMANSDAHIEWLIGHCATSFPGHTAADLRQALVARQTQAEVHLSKRLLDFYFSHANRFLMKRMGLRRAVGIGV